MNLNQSKQKKSNQNSSKGRIRPNSTSNFSLIFLLLISLSSLTQVKAQSISDKTLMGYWHNWGPEFRLIDIPSDYNVVVIAFASTGFDGTNTFTPNYDVTTFKADILALQGENRKVLISIGGEGSSFSLSDITQKDNFVQSMKSLIDEYNFDGLDVDLEGSSVQAIGDADFKNPSTTTSVMFLNAIDELLTHYGDSFILTTAPETYYVQRGYQGFESHKGAFLPFLHKFHDRIDYLAVQLYNTPEEYGLDNALYSSGTKDFLVSQIHMLLHGIPVGGLNANWEDKEWLAGFDASQVLVGLPASQTAAGSGQITDENLNAALNALILGETSGLQYQKLEHGYPKLGGLMTWSINWDKDERNYGFANNFTTYLNGLSSLSLEYATDVNFGNIDANRSYTQSYVITNYNDAVETVNITNISEGLIINQTGFTIQPLSSAVIELVINTTLMGTFAGSFTCNFSSQASTSINVNAEVGCFKIRGMEEKFEGSTLSSNWTPSSNMALSLDNGKLLVNASKSDFYESFGLATDVFDLSQHPTVSYDIESDVNLKMRIDFGDENGYTTNGTPHVIEYIGGSGVKTISLNFENIFLQLYPEEQVVDRTKINHLLVYPNPGETFFGSFKMDNIVIGDPMTFEYDKQANFCDGSSYVFGTQTITAEGIYKEVFQNSMGCDSTVNLTLTAIPTYTKDIAETICANESFLFGGAELSTTDIYQHIFQSSLGCDSTVNLTLNVNPIYSETTTEIICSGESFNFGTQVLDAEGTYQEIFQSTLGCDSTVDLTLQVNPVYNEEAQITICEGTDYNFGMQVLTEAGTYTELFESITSCDSTVNLTITIVPNTLSPVISVDETTLTVSSTNVDYQWLDCNTSTPITNEINQTYTATKSGNFAVTVSDEFCQSTSDCEIVEIILSSFDKLDEDKIEIYPNPTTSIFKVNLGAKPITGDYEINDINGSSIVEGKINNQNELLIDLSNKSGVYILRIVDEQGASYIKRIIKQ